MRDLDALLVARCGEAKRAGNTYIADDLSRACSDAGVPALAQLAKVLSTKKHSSLPGPDVPFQGDWLLHALLCAKNQQAARYLPSTTSLAMYGGATVAPPLPRRTSCLCSTRFE